MGVEAGIPLMHQLMDPHHKKFPGLLPESCTTTAMTSSSNLNFGPFSTFLRGMNRWKSHGDLSRLYRVWFNTFQCMECSMSLTVWATWGQHCHASWWQPLWAWQDAFSWLQHGHRRFHSSAACGWWCQGPWMLVLNDQRFRSDQDVKTMVVLEASSSTTGSFVGGDPYTSAWMGCCLNTHGDYF
jgi:hypothetical protein